MLNDNKNMNKKIPEDFFTDFQSKLRKTVKDMDMIDLLDEAPILSSLEKETGLIVPENYFDDLSITETVVSHQTKVLNIYQISRIAASVLLLMMVGFFALYHNQSELSSEDQLLAEFEYISSELDDEHSIFETIMADSESYFEVELEDLEIESLIENNIDQFELTELEELL